MRIVFKKEVNMERTFVAIKPDGVKRGLIGKILERFENKSYKIIAMKLINVTPEVAAKHYEEHVGKPFYDKLIKFIQISRLQQFATIADLIAREHLIAYLKNVIE